MPKFHVEIVKPSHYDDDGYVLQWWKAWIPSNSMASLYAISEDAGARGVLGDVAIETRAYDEMTMRVPRDEIVARIRKDGGIVCLVGVQSNQYPRALDLARQVMERGGLSGAIFNAAKERALDGFIARRIAFTEMSDVVARVLDRMDAQPGLIDAPFTLDNILQMDHLARCMAENVMAQRQ